MGRVPALGFCGIPLFTQEASSLLALVLALSSAPRIRHVCGELLGVGLRDHLNEGVGTYTLGEFLPFLVFTLHPARGGKSFTPGAGQIRWLSETIECLGAPLHDGIPSSGCACPRGLADGGLLLEVLQFSEDNQLRFLTDEVHPLLQSVRRQTHVCTSRGCGHTWRWGGWGDSSSSEQGPNIGTLGEQQVAAKVHSGRGPSPSGLGDVASMLQAGQSSSSSSGGWKVAAQAPSSVSPSSETSSEPSDGFRTARGSSGDFLTPRGASPGSGEGVSADTEYVICLDMRDAAGAGGSKVSSNFEDLVRGHVAASREDAPTVGCPLCCRLGARTEQVYDSVADVVAFAFSGQPPPDASSALLQAAVELPLRVSLHTLMQSSLLPERGRAGKIDDPPPCHELHCVIAMGAPGGVGQQAGMSVFLLLQDPRAGTASPQEGGGGVTGLEEEDVARAGLAWFHFREGGVGPAQGERVLVDAAGSGLFPLCRPLMCIYSRRGADVPGTGHFQATYGTSPDWAGGQAACGPRYHCGALHPCVAA